MCGRYALALRPSQIRRMLEEDDTPVQDAPDDSPSGPGAPRQSYNFAPGYNGVVYRGVADGNHHRHGDGAVDAVADPETEDHEDGAGRHQTTEHHQRRGGGLRTAGKKTAHTDSHTRYILQSMKWGLIPSWTRRRPDYASTLKTINCRDDSLARQGGMWASMKTRKRCVVVAQGFYEWLKPRGLCGGGSAGAAAKHKVPHYVRRADGRLMCFAGLWDCVRYGDGEDGGGGGDKGEGEGGRAGPSQYTYTIITTDSNQQLRFLHDRMPVILDQGSEAMRVWLDPERDEWSAELQGVLKPYAGTLEVYPVSREVGKVGNDSPSFIIPVASRENKGNIANFFANAAAAGSPEKKTKVKMEKAGGTDKDAAAEPEVEVRRTSADGQKTKLEHETVDEAAQEADDGEMTRPAAPATAGMKRGVPSPSLEDEQPPPAKKGAHVKKASPPSPVTKARTTRSATSNAGKSPGKVKGGKGKQDEGSKKITQFFANSA